MASRKAGSRKKKRAQFVGFSATGDLAEALANAVTQVPSSPAMTNWEVRRIFGKKGGFTGRSDISVLIFTSKPRPLASKTPAHFQVFDDSNPKRPFVIQLFDPGQIAHARRVIAGQETARVHIRGRIIKSAAAYNPEWSFHLDPASIDFFEYSIEVCDASIAYVEKNLDKVGTDFLPNGDWCPWGSRIRAEVTKQLHLRD